MKKIVMTAAMAIASFGAFAANTTSNASQTLNITLEKQIEISPNGGAQTASQTFTTVDNFDNGMTFNGQTWTIKSNWDYSVYAMAEGTGSNFTYNGPSSIYTAMSLNKLMMKIVSWNGGNSDPATNPMVRNGFGDYTSINAAATPAPGVEIARGEVGVRNMETSYKLTPGWDQAAGSYTATVKVTATMN